MFKLSSLLLWVTLQVVSSPPARLFLWTYLLITCASYMKTLVHRCTIINSDFKSNTATHRASNILGFVFLLSPCLPSEADAFLTSAVLHASSVLFLVSIIFFYWQNKEPFPSSHRHCCCCGWWDQLLTAESTILLPASPLNSSKLPFVSLLGDWGKA